MGRGGVRRVGAKVLAVCSRGVLEGIVEGVGRGYWSGKVKVEQGLRIGER